MSHKALDIDPHMDLALENASVPHGTGAGEVLLDAVTRQAILENASPQRSTADQAVVRFLSRISVVA